MELSPEGYAAKEFDKVAPSPGINWDGPTAKWPDQASKNGWIVKTSATDAKSGSIIIGSNEKNNVWIGIVREINDTGIRIETFDPQNRQMQKTINYDSLVSEYKLIGYIWPERMTPRLKLVIH